MQSKIYFTYRPNGTLEKIATDTDHLFQGQVGTAEFRVYVDSEWLPTDVVLISFERPDGQKTNQFMSLLSDDRLGWRYVSNGWETDNPPGILKVSFVMRRYSGVQPDREVQTLTTEQAMVQIHASAGYTPLQIEMDDADIIISALADLAAQQARDNAELPNAVKSIQKVAGNAFTYTNVGGVESAPIILDTGQGGDPPMSVMAVWTGIVDLYAWQRNPTTGDILEYVHTIPGSLHGQLKDGATADELRISFLCGDERRGDVKLFGVTETGDITIRVNEPVRLAVSVWNGRGIKGEDGKDGLPSVDETARHDIANLIVVNSIEPQEKVPNQLWMQEVYK